MSKLPAVLRSPITLLILGRCIEDSLDKLTKEAASTDSMPQIIYQNEFISENAVAQSDWLFAMHTDFYCPSGTVGHAAKHGRGLIATNAGLIGRLVKEHKLGLAADPYSADDIAKKTEEAMSKPFVHSADTVNFVSANSPQNFAKSLLQL